MPSRLDKYHLAFIKPWVINNILNLNSVTVHSHPLGAPAHLAISRRADWSAAGVSSSTALLQGQKLLSTESLVVDLRRRLDQVLQVSASEEVAKVHEFAVSLVLDVDDTPAVLASANLLATDNDGLLGSDNSEWDDVLENKLMGIPSKRIQVSYLDLRIQGALLLVKLIVVVWVHLQVVEGELFLDSLLECAALLKC